jgi:hypothetical protein
MLIFATLSRAKTPQATLKHQVVMILAEHKDTMARVFLALCALFASLSPCVFAFGCIPRQFLIIIILLFSTIIYGKKCIANPASSLSA